MDHWVPMAHCLTASDEEPTAAGVAVSLGSITEGRLEVEVRSPAASITVPLSSAQDDLADLLRFTSLVEQGANPHLVFAGDGVNVFAVFPYHGMEGVSLRIRRPRPADESELKDVVTSRRAVVAVFSPLARGSEERRVGKGCVSVW